MSFRLPARRFQYGYSPVGTLGWKWTIMSVWSETSSSLALWSIAHRLPCGVFVSAVALGFVGLLHRASPTAVRSITSRGEAPFSFSSSILPEHLEDEDEAKT